MRVQMKDHAPPTGKGLRWHLIKGAGGSFVLQVGFAGLSMFNAVFLARVLGAEGYGAYANAMSWVTLLTIPATFGFGILLVREAAVYRAQKKWALFKGLLRFSDRFVLALSIALALLAAGVAAWVFSAPEQAILRHSIWIALLMLPLLALYNLREASLRGLEYVIRARLPGMLVRPGLLLAGIAAIYYLVGANHLSATRAMTVNVGAAVIALGLSVFFLRKLLPAEVRSAAPEYTPRPWLKAAFPMLVYGGAQIVFGQTDIVMLGAMRGAEAVGLYAAASRLAFLLVYVMTAFNVILAPVMARMNADDEHERLQNIITKIARGSFFVALPVGLSMIFGGQYILEFFGTQFVLAQPVLIILAIGRLADLALGGNSTLLLSMSGHEKIVSKVFLATSLVNIVLNALLIQLYSIRGAAMASVISLVITKIILGVYAVTRAGYHMTIFGKVGFMTTLEPPIHR